MSKTDGFKADSLRGLLLHHVVGEVIVKQSDDLENSGAIDINDFSRALRTAAEIQSLTGDEISKRVSDLESGGLNRVTEKSRPTEPASQGLLQMSESVMDIFHAVSENAPDCAAVFSSGLVVGWNVAAALLNCALESDIRKFQISYPTLTMDDHRREASAASQGAGAWTRRERMRSVMDAVLVGEAAKRIAAGSFDPKQPPIKAEVARKVSANLKGELAPSTISKYVTAKEIRDIWARQSS